jgi:hypothetical protein
MFLPCSSTTHRYAESRSRCSQRGHGVPAAQSPRHGTPKGRGSFDPRPESGRTHSRGHGKAQSSIGQPSSPAVMVRSPRAMSRSSHRLQTHRSRMMRIALGNAGTALFRSSTCEAHRRDTRNRGNAPVVHTVGRRPGGIHPHAVGGVGLRRRCTERRRSRVLSRHAHRRRAQGDRARPRDEPTDFFESQPLLCHLGSPRSNRTRSNSSSVGIATPAFATAAS